MIDDFSSKIRKQINPDALISYIKVVPIVDSPFEDYINGKIQFDGLSSGTDRLIFKGLSCKECKKDMFKLNDNTAYICYDCGLMEYIIGDEIEPDKVSSSASSNYNTSGSLSAPIRVMGPGQNYYQKSLISKTSDYKKTQLRDTIKQLQNILYQSKGGSTSQSLIIETAEMYHKIQQHTIKRGDVRKGTLAACLNSVCKKHNIIRKPKEISDMFGIEQGDLSNGEKILDELKNIGVVKDSSAPWSDQPKPEKKTGSETTQLGGINLFLLRYYELLEIPHTFTKREKREVVDYMTFAQQLIKFTVKFRIAEHSIPSSRCAGAIYILSLKCPELNVKIENIENKCGSRSTFKRFAKDVLDLLKTNDEKKRSLQNKLKHLFNKYKIPLSDSDSLLSQKNY